MQGQPTLAECARIDMVGYCLDCRVKHRYHCTPADFLQRMSDWRQKHLGHAIEFRSPRRRPRARQPKHLEKTWQEQNETPWWLGQGTPFRDNNDIKLAYVASGTYTMTLAALASSSTLVAGRESNSVSNTTNLYLDYLLGGWVKAGTTVTAGTIELWGVAAIDDTPNWPDVFDGVDSVETVTTADIKRNCGKLLWTMPNDTTNGRVYPWTGISLAAAFGGLVPASHVLFLTHSMVAALDATEANHLKAFKAAYLTSI
jgi:hypothetical protein